jgi:hypothetical protein
MAVTSKKPILVDQPILEGLQRLRDDECRRSTVGAAPSIQELARHLLRQGMKRRSGVQEQNKRTGMAAAKEVSSYRLGESNAVNEITRMGANSVRYER